MILHVLRGVLLLLWLAAPAAVAQEPPELRLDDLVREAMANNPGLKAARYQTLSAQARTGQLRAWEPPQIGVEYAQTPTASFPNPWQDAMETDYFIQQKLPFPGKLPAMVRASERASAMRGFTAQAMENNVIREVETAYYGLYLVRQKLRINRDSQQLMREFKEIARRQYEVGGGKQADLLRAQTELSLLINEGRALALEQRISEARINALLGRPAEEPLGPVPDLAEALPTESEPPPGGATPDNRPEVKAMDEGIRMSAEELALARREYFPDIMLRLMYKRMENAPTDYFATMVSVELPFLFFFDGKVRGKVEESRLNVMKAREESRDLRNMVGFQIREAWLNAQTGKETVALYKSTILPQAEQTLLSVKAAYQTGNGEFFALIDVSRMYLDARLSYCTAVAGYLTSRAALAQATGTRPTPRIEEELP